MIYIFNNFQIDLENFTIESNGEKIEVEPRVFDLIIYLIENKAKVVTREELFDNVWKNQNVLDATLSNHIQAARMALGDDGKSQHTIKTVHGRGYQFVAEINDLTQTSSSKTLVKALIYLAVFTTLIFGLYTSLRKTNTLVQRSNTITEKKSIAVLAFLDLSPEHNQEYFSDGMSEEILNKLAQVPDLRVISRTSSFYYKDKELTANEIGKQLNVSHILEGSVRKQKDILRITVQLIESKTSKHIWSETYDKTINDIFQIQDDIAQAVSNKLTISLIPNPVKPVAVNLDAYIEYLKAKHLSHTSTRDNSKKTELIIRKSIALDPNYAPSWHLLGHIIFKSTLTFGMRSFKDGVKTSSYAISKALELDQNHAPSYAKLARIKSQLREFNSAEENLQKAISLDDKSSYILKIAAQNALMAGELNTSLEYSEQIKNIDPKYFRNYYSIGKLYFILQKYDLAILNFEIYRKSKPENAVVNHLISSVLIAQGKSELAIEYANNETNKFWKDYANCMALFADGQITKANLLLSDFIKKNGNSSLTNIARIYASRGETDKTFKWLYKAFDHPDSTLLSWLNFPEFQKMHNDPRWHSLIRKMEFPDNHWLVKKLPKSNGDTL